MMYRFEVQNSKENQGNRVQYGSMVSKFSPSGFLLAFHCTTYRRQNHEVVILNVNNLKIRNTLIGHLNIVYDLDWLNEKVLCSVSSDRTAIVWFLSENEFSLKVILYYRLKGRAIIFMFSFLKIPDSSTSIIYLYR